MIRSRVRRAAQVPLLLVALAPAGCDDPTGVDPEDVEFAAELGVNLSQMTRLPSGVYIQTLRAGEEPTARAGSVIRTNYTLWLPNGTRIDARESANFTLDPAEVIQGFALGATGIKTGEIRLIVIPSELGFGEFGSGPIPGNSVLVFRLEMVELISSP